MNMKLPQLIIDIKTILFCITSFLNMLFKHANEASNVNKSPTQTDKSSKINVSPPPA